MTRCPSVHLLLRDKASWIEPQIGANDDCFDGYPELSIEDWHKKTRVVDRMTAPLRKQTADRCLLEIMARPRDPEHECPLGSRAEFP
jgi:hypothetical protein